MPFSGLGQTHTHIHAGYQHIDDEIDKLVSKFPWICSQPKELWSWKDLKPDLLVHVIAASVMYSIRMLVQCRIICRHGAVRHRRNML